MSLPEQLSHFLVPDCVLFYVLVPPPCLIPVPRSAPLLSNKAAVSLCSNNSASSSGVHDHLDRGVITQGVSTVPRMKPWLHFLYMDMLTLKRELPSI